MSPEATAFPVYFDQLQYMELHNSKRSPVMSKLRYCYQVSARVGFEIVTEQQQLCEKP